MQHQNCVLRRSQQPAGQLACKLPVKAAAWMLSKQRELLRFGAALGELQISERCGLWRRQRQFQARRIRTPSIQPGWLSASYQERSTLCRWGGVGWGEAVESSGRPAQELRAFLPVECSIAGNIGLCKKLKLNEAKASTPRSAASGLVVRKALAFP
eukprot:364876-Chlamydomonas_euryale.AAC.3